MEKSIQKTARRNARHARIRARVTGTKERPRLAVYKSNRFVYAQLIDDESNHTIAAVDSRGEKAKSMTERAKAVGTKIADAAKKAKIEKVVFDRGGFRYQGVIAAVAEGAREGGLQF